MPPDTDAPLSHYAEKQWAETEPELREMMGQLRQLSRRFSAIKEEEQLITAVEAAFERHDLSEIEAGL